MIIYLLKSIVCLGLFLIFYLLFLEREKMHQFNRFYLLGSFLLSLIIPLLVIYVEPSAIANEIISKNETYINKVIVDNAVAKNTSKSKKHLLVKKLALLPLLAILVFLFANRFEAQRKKELVYVQKTQKEATKEQMEEYKNLMKSIEKSGIYKLKDGKRLQELLDLISKEQRKTVKNKIKFKKLDIIEGEAKEK